MKAAILKLGFNKITFENRRVTNGNLGEVELIMRLFAKNGWDLVVCDSQIGMDARADSAQSVEEHYRKDNPKIKVWHFSTVDEVDQTIDADILVVIGGTVNFFGGADGNCLLQAYHHINKFPGKVLFFYTDPLCPPVKTIGRPGIKQKYTNVPSQITLTKPMTLINCAKTFDLTKKPWSAKGVITEFEEVIDFEFSQSAIFGESLNVHSGPKTIDLIYGGFYRGGKRRKQMIEYFFDVPYNAKFFGGIEEDMFKLKPDEVTKLPEFDKRKGNWDFFKAETNKALATVIFAEDTYQNNITTMRVYCSALSGVIVLVDKAYDPEYKLFGVDFYYVDGREDMIKKIDRIKEMLPGEYQECVNYQNYRLRIDEDKYYSDFIKLIGY